MVRKNGNRHKNTKDQSQPPAIVARFDEHFGAGDLQDWQRLCSDIFRENELKSFDLCSKTKCRKLLKTVFINIQDLVDCIEKNLTGEHPKVYPQRFASLNQLVKYTMKEGKVYPKKWVKNGLGPVKALMRDILRG
ncbi:hypothetical protein QC762_107795 [Podospora pseudocomata]|uniref:Uncharacterized protein n=1 Tax=Podospora pseudocomata TaxID=2093779 RepID=A0ABR0GU58_9PEZI|nr:hypothetical protein QC762_107795 [Podospora pseudocomata]